MVVATLGLGLFVWASYGSQDRLEKRYEVLVDDYMDKLEDLVKSATSIPDQNSDEATELKKEFEETRQTIQVYLNKLIALDPENREYQYKLATTTYFGATDQEKIRGIELMQAIAPEDVPGYAKAHLWLARFFESQLQRTSDRSRRVVAEKILLHLGFCLDRDPKNQLAQRLKASVLRMVARFNESYEMYESLFEKDPYVYASLYELDLLRIQRSIDQTDEEKQANADRRELLLKSAQVRFQDRLKKAEGEEQNSRWAADWQALVRILVIRRKFKEAEKILKEAISTAQSKPDSSSTPISASRIVALRNLLVAIYNAWSVDIASEFDEYGIRTKNLLVPDLNEEQLREQIEILKKGLELAPNNPDILNRIATIALSNSPVSAVAREIYDPRLETDPPASVLAQLGNRALNNEDYANAIDYFTRAREKSNNDPTILNNLAYSHLVTENPNPDLSLSLIREAIAKLPRLANVRIREVYRSNFFDTQGHALLQLNDPVGAAESFLVALKLRPEETKILDALVQCYEQSGNDAQADVYRKRLAEVKSKKAQTEANQNQPEQK